MHLQMELLKYGASQMRSSEKYDREEYGRCERLCRDCGGLGVVEIKNGVGQWFLL